MSTDVLVREVQDSAKAIGLLHGDGSLNTHWFSQPLDNLGKIFSNADQRDAFLDLLDQLLPPQPLPGLASGEKWHPLLGDPAQGNVYLTVTDAGGGRIVIGAAGEFHASASSGVPSAALRACLPLIALQGTSVTLLAGSADGPLDVSVRVQLNWTRPAQAIALAAINIALHLAPLAGTATASVILEGLDLDGSGAKDTPLDPTHLDSQAMKLVLGLVSQKLHEIAGTAAGEAAALAAHLMPLLGFGDAAIPAFPFVGLLQGPAALQVWLNTMVSSGGITTWLGHLAGLFGSTVATAGGGTPADPWRVRLLALDGATSELDVLLAKVGQQLNVGIRILVVPGGATPPVRLEAEAMLVGVPLSGTGPAQVLPSASVVLRAPGSAGSLIAPGGTIAVDSLRGGISWNGSALTPLLELVNVDFSGVHYDQIDLTHADSVVAAASAAVKTAILNALGNNATAKHLAALSGLLPPAGDAAWPFTIADADLPKLLANPSGTIASVHRAALLSAAHHWGFLLAEIGGLIGLSGAVAGTGKKNDPWRIPLEAIGPLNLELAAWNAQESGNAADPQWLRLGLRLSASSSPWLFWWLAELLAFDLPASGSGDVRLMAGQHAQFLLQPAPSAPALAGMTIAADSLGITLDWDPGAPLALRGALNNLRVSSNGTTVTVGSLVFPPATPFDVTNPASIGISSAQLESVVRLLATRAAFSWAGMPGMAFSALTGLGSNLPGLQPDWPVLRGPGTAGSMFTDPFGALRDWLARVAANVSADGTPYLPQALDWLRALLGNALPPTPNAAAPMADDPLQGSGVYEDPWSLPVAGTETHPVELLAWLEPAGPPANWVAPIAAKIASAGAFQTLLQRAAALRPFLPDVRDALAMANLDALAEALDDLATHLAGSDGVVPVTSQIPTGGTWSTGTPLTSAHPNQPMDPSAISQVLAQLNTWLGGGARCVLLLGPAFSDHTIWKDFLTQAETARPGSTNAAAFFNLREPGVDPASVDLNAVTVTADYYTANLRDEGTGNLASLTAQIGRIVGRLGQIRAGEKVVLLAHSTAGVAARAYCAANAANVSGLITIGSPHAGAPLTVLRDAASAESVRLIERLTPALAAGPLKDAIDHLRHALDGVLPSDPPGGLPAPFPYPVGSFSTTPSTDTGGVRAFALGGALEGDLFEAVKQAITALATGASGAATPVPTHISFGLRSTLAVPNAPAGAVQAEVKLRADAFRIALSTGAAEPSRPAHSLAVLATLHRVNGWLAGAPNSYAGEGAPLVDVRVRWAELGATIIPAAGSITVTPLLRLHQAAFHGPSVSLTQLADSLASPLLGAVLESISVPIAGSSVTVLLDALSKLGVAVPDPHGGTGISADALQAIQTDARAYLAPRLPAALGDPAGFLGFSGPPVGPWTMPIGTGPFEVYLSNTPEWQIGVRTTGTARLAMGTSASLGVDARVNIPSFTTGLDLSFSLAAITLNYSQSARQLTLAAPPWLDLLTLVPLPPTSAITAALSSLVPRLLLSGVVTGLLESILPANFNVGPIDRFLASPGSSFSSGSSLGSGSGGFDAAKINALLTAIGAAIGSSGPGLGLPAGLRLSASGTGTITLRLATTANIGGVLGFELDANVDSLRHVSPAGTLSLRLPLPGTWPGVTIAFGIAPAGITLSITPDDASPIQLLPRFSGLGALAGAAEALLPSALNEVVAAFGATPPAFVNLVLQLAQSFNLYDDATKFTGHAAQWRALLQGDWLGTISSTVRTQAASAFEQLFNNPASPLKGVLPGAITSSAQTVTWTFSPGALGSGSIAATLGWDSAGPTLNVQAANFKLNNGPIGLTLGAGYAMNSVQATAGLAFNLQSSLGINAAPQFSATFSGGGFQAHLLPLGAGTSSALDIELLPSPAVHLGPGGPVQFMENWLLPIVADLAVQAARSKLGTSLWTGMTLRQLLTGAGIIGAEDALAQPLPNVTTMVTGLLTGLASSVDIPITSTLNLKFVSEGGKLGLRLRGHQDFNAGSLTVTAQFGEPATWIADVNRGVTLYLFNVAGLNFAPRLEVVGLGVGLSQGDSPLVNTSFLRLGGAAGYLFFNLNLTGGISLENFGAGIDLEQFGIPLGQAFGGGAGGNPVAASLLQSDGGSAGGDAQPVNPAVDLFAAYRNGTFVIKVQGSDQAIWLGIHRQFGPLYIDQIGLEILSAPPPAVALLVDGSINIAGLTVQADELGVTVPLRSLTSPGDWTLDLRGLAIAYNNGGIDIAGGLLKNPGPPIEYDGMLTVHISDLGLTAVGAYSRPSDDLGQYTSLFIFVALNFPLGGPPFFFVTGLGGGAGYNRRLLVPTDMNQVPSFLLVKAIDDSGFANDPMGALRQIAGSIPSRRGSLWFAAGVKFDSFVLVHTIAVIYVSLDKGVEIGVLGVSRMALPSEDLAIASVELALKARFSTAEGILSVQAQLTDNSYIFARQVQLTGGFAFFAWFPRGQFVLTIGGYHPAFDKPPEFPDVPRLGFRWRQFPVSIKGEAYFALTNSCVMAGGRLEVAYDLDIVRAWFIAYADFLVSWDPFHYDIQIGVSVGAALDFEVCFIVCGHVHLEISLGASVHVLGPQLHADVSVDLDVTSVTISFGADPNPKPNYITDFNVFQQKYLASGSSSDTPVVVRITQGLLPPEPPGATPTPGSKDQPWILRSEFIFTTDSRMPAGGFSSFLAPPAPADGAAALDLAAMHKLHIGSVHDVRIYLGDSMSPAPADAQHFTIEQISGLFPEATWRFTEEGQQKAAANTLQALSGLRITASAVMVGQSSLIPISNMVDDLPERSLPLPFATLTAPVISALQVIGTSAEQLSQQIAGSDKMLAGAEQVLAGTNQFADLRKQAGLPAAGLSSMAQRSLRKLRSAPPLVAPLSTGLTMKPVGLAQPPVIFRKPETPPVVLDRPRLRATLQGRPLPTTDAPPAIRTTAHKVSAAKAVRMAPPVATALVGSQLHLLPADNAPRATRAAIARRSIQHPETGLLSGAAHGADLDRAASQLLGAGVLLPSGATHVWDVPPQQSHTFLLQGESAARVICLDRGGHVLLDQEMVAHAQQVVTPANTSTVVFSCMGILPAGLKAPSPGFGIISFNAAPAFGLPAVGWQVGDSREKIGPSTFIGRGSSIILPRVTNVNLRRQNAAIAMVRVADVLQEQTATETWFPSAVSTVMIILDGQDTAAATDGDLALAVENATLATPPIPIIGGRRRTLLYDVASRTAGTDHFVVSVASKSGWSISGVVGLAGNAVEWANRFHGDVPERITADGPLSPGGALQVQLLPAPKPQPPAPAPVAPPSPIVGDKS